MQRSLLRFLALVAIAAPRAVAGAAVVFGGSSEGLFYALDAATGKPLWRFPTGGPIFASPVSFLVDGRQHVAIAAGNALFAFAVD